MTSRRVPILILAAGLASPGCNEGRDEADPRPGVTCFVMFRRDALGLADKDVVSPDTYMEGMGRFGVAGKITRTTSRWVVLVTSEKEEYWVPREAILCVMQRPDGGDFGVPFAPPPSAAPHSPPPTSAPSEAIKTSSR